MSIEVNQIKWKKNIRVLEIFMETINIRNSFVQIELVFFLAMDVNI